MAIRPYNILSIVGAKHSGSPFNIFSIVRAKHSGSPFNIFSNKLSAGMLRPYRNASPLRNVNICYIFLPWSSLWYY
ncbi:hypothetical protein [Planktothricoides raciborskii]|uniref:Uncharacterized protein n=1 Tax=Planktothricoides raciborskii FACHB-1370 TaxID=2949576 RepID=A0ABR8EF95_9CYAN|nr:hypothetical protein [Planktothricoides raciborskii]MBD2545260.1 hypothetical protein [Planktothricoides raciborskii FACHB-1370]MBD2584423.1 hypothetical protein [Planktothricoides raciborskii FACHB-1261]